MWANGSVILLLSSWWFMHLWIYDAALILRDPTMDEMKPSKRRVTFAFSVMFLSYWVVSFLATQIKLRIKGPFVETH